MNIRKRNVTQKDIARQLNVSQSLVAAVLSNKPDVWVSEANRLRIHDAAAEMNYRPNSAARSLRSGRTRSVTIALLTAQDNNIVAEVGHIIFMLANFLAENQYDLKVKMCSHQEQLLRELSDIAHTGSCDVIVITGPDDLVEEQGILLERLQMPFIVIGNHSERHPDWYQIDFDHEQMMAKAVQHLAALGHRRLAFIGHNTKESYNQRLKRGFCRAVETALGHPPSPDFMGRVDVNEFAHIRATDLINAWMACPADEQPTAFVFGANDDQSWREAEMALLRFGRTFSHELGGFSASGLHYSYSPLLFGQADAFLNTDLGYLTEVMCKQLLAVLLRSETPVESQLKVCPALQPLKTLDLAKHHLR